MRDTMSTSKITTIDTARMDERSRIAIPKLVKDALDLTPSSKDAPGSLIAFKKDEDGRVFIERLD
jgi:bifunctional DNA-binding transcriptional regulator/antitoxin component of YhaV-PrlF toxin-antitoxin module